MTTATVSATTMRRRVAVSSLLGTTIEWYDYFIYGAAAALVFAPQFFPTASPLAGTLASFATFAVGFIARPIGGLVFGHFGDRVGRKSMLVLSMLLMGGGTVLIGLLPNYDTIGVAAPVLLVLLRIVQGFGVGGEWGGAVLMAIEHAPRQRRTLYGSIAQMGLPLGIVVSNLAFLILLAVSSPQSFAAWGWRIPFLLSAVLIVVGFAVRMQITESPAFEQVKARGEVVRTPLVRLVTEHVRPLAVASLASIAAPALGYLVLVYVLSYGTTVLGVPRTTMLWLIVGGGVVWFLMIWLAAMAAERFGGRAVFLFGAALSTAWAFPFFALLDTADTGAIFVAIAVAATAVAFMAGPQAALVAGMFPPPVRYSGASSAYQLGSVLGGALAPLIATALYASSGTSVPIAVYMAVLGAVSIGAILLVPRPTLELETVEHTAAAGAA
jgi:metabolite-proton symporter